MKNDGIPLIQALKGRAQPKGHAPLPQFEGPRSFDLQHHEIPGLPGKHVGEHISVTLHGHVHSQHSDGHAVMHVASVKPDSTEMTKKEHPDMATPSKSGAVNVQTQESHAP